jgi:hypothetical protein
VYKTVQVLPVTLSLARTQIGDITLKNNADHDIDLSGYTLKGAHAVEYPPHTFLQSGGMITVEGKRLGSFTHTVQLYDTEKVTVASLAFGPQPPAPQRLTLSSSPRAGNTVRTVEPPEPTEPLLSDTKEEDVAPASVAAVTIPVYAQGEEGANTWRQLRVYTGLGVILLLGILFLYARREQ